MSKKICPELELAAYYCTTDIVSRKYFTEEVVWIPQEITSGWLKRAESGARQVRQMRAYAVPRTLERIPVLSSHYKAWTMIKAIIDKIKTIFDNLVAIERSRDSYISMITEDYRKAEVQYKYFASRRGTFPPGLTEQNKWEWDNLEEMVTLFVKDSYVTRAATIGDTAFLARKEKQGSATEKKRTRQFEILRSLTPYDLLSMADYPFAVRSHYIKCYAP